MAMAELVATMHGLGCARRIDQLTNISCVNDRHGMGGRRKERLQIYQPRVACPDVVAASSRSLQIGKSNPSASDGITNT
jgi:hypothetical protein